jgi:hypothetical protein
MPVVSAELTTPVAKPAAPAARLAPAAPHHRAAGETRVTDRFRRPGAADRRAVKPTPAPQPAAAAPAAPSTSSSTPVTPPVQPAAAPRPAPASETVAQPVRAAVERVAATVDAVAAPLPIVDDAATTATAALRQLASGL